MRSSAPAWRGGTGATPAPPSRAWVHVALIVAGALYGATDEWHQSFVPGRDASVLDWLADLCGVTLGYSGTLATVTPEPGEGA